jgi:predicted lipoprotein with Yx(FWY)xxD motif
MKRFMTQALVSILTVLPMVSSADCGTTGGSTPPAPVRGITSMTKLVQNDEKENLVADVYSRTLYVFDADLKQTTSKCDGVCAEHWPAVLLTADEAKALVAPLGAIVRTSNQLQLTFDGRPVYTYAFDRHVGDDQGDGLGGVWHYIEIK